VTLVSCAITCWVRSAIRAAFSDGRARPRPWVRVERLGAAQTPARASIAVRAMLTSAVGRSVRPRRFGVETELPTEFVSRAVVVFIHVAQSPRRSVLGDLFEEVDVALKKNESRGGDLIDRETGFGARVRRRRTVGQCERRASSAAVDRPLECDTPRLRSSSTWHLGGGEGNGGRARVAWTGAAGRRTPSGLVLLQDGRSATCRRAGCAPRPIFRLGDEERQPSRGGELTSWTSLMVLSRCL